MAAIKHDANTDIVRGQLFVFVDNLPIAFANTASMNLTTEEVDVSNKMMGGWSASLPGKKTFTVSSSSMLTQKEGQMSFDTLFKKQLAGETVDFWFGEAKVTEETNVGGKFEPDLTKRSYSGVMMITSLDLKSDSGQIATCDASFKGVGGINVNEPQP